MNDNDARFVYVYEVEPCYPDGRGTSGWSVTVVTESPDLSDLARIVQVELASDRMSINNPEAWSGIKSAKLVTTAVLDPRIA